MEETTRAKAIEFIETMEARHDQVIGELDLLNDRVQKVLDEYLLSRKNGSLEESPADEKVA